MADTKAPRKLTKAQLEATVLELSHQNAELVRQLKQAQADVGTYLSAVRLHKETASRVEDSMFRLRNQARAIKRWAEKYHSDKPVIVHAVDAVLFVPGYGEVHPFARWGYPGLELVA